MTVPTARGWFRATPALALRGQDGANRVEGKFSVRRPNFANWTPLASRMPGVLSLRTAVASGMCLAWSETVSRAVNVHVAAEGGDVRTAIALLVLAGVVSEGVAAGQSATATAGTGEVLATVRITHAVLANGKPLPAGTYELRATGERPTPLAGQSPDAERWVEFVANGTVVAREVATVLRDDDRPSVGASSEPVRTGTRVEMLKDGDFLRVSVKQEVERYLVYLPVAH